MNSNPIIISFSSWEDRFLNGQNRLLAEKSPKKLISYFSKDYSEWTNESRLKLANNCADMDVPFTGIELDESPAEAWKEIVRNLPTLVGPSDHVIVDTSTMPREKIWFILWALESITKNVSYVYFSPIEYGDWLSRDPQRPRLVFQLSGISQFSKKTALILLVGYDLDRAQQLISFYDPECVYIGLQETGLDSQNDDWMQRNAEKFGDKPNFTLFRLNAVSNDCGKSGIIDVVEKLSDEYNIIMSSLGPKLTAISLYNIVKERPEIGLTYAPSKEFSRNYSTGISTMHEGVL